MKTLKQLLREAIHHTGSQNTGQWGVIVGDKVIDGTKHPWATCHDDLDRGTARRENVSYSVDRTNGSLHVRTSSKIGLQNLLSNIHKLPQPKSGVVHHDHHYKSSETYLDDEGRERRVWKVKSFSGSVDDLIKHGNRHLQKARR